MNGLLQAVGGRREHQSSTVTVLTPCTGTRRSRTAVQQVLRVPRGAQKPGEGCSLWRAHPAPHTGRALTAPRTGLPAVNFQIRPSPWQRRHSASRQAPLEKYAELEILGPLHPLPAANLNRPTPTTWEEPGVQRGEAQLLPGPRAGGSRGTATPGREAGHRRTLATVCVERDGEKEGHQRGCK